MVLKMILEASDIRIMFEVGNGERMAHSTEQ